MSYWGAQLLNGLSFGMLLFFLASGLTLTLGVMRIVNLTHGSFYLVGAYIAFTAVQSTGSFGLGTAAATVVVAAMGAVVFRLLRFTGENQLRQTLLTFGILLIISDLSVVIWGGGPVAIAKPALLKHPIDVLGVSYPSYRLFVILAGAVLAGGLYALQRWTLVGAMVRAVVDDQEMATGVGLNAKRIGFATFVAGAALAGLAGSLGGTMIGAYPGADIEVLLFALVIVIIGGMGSINGSFLASLAVGLLDTIGRVELPELGASLMFVLMLVTLIVRPQGFADR